MSQGTVFQLITKDERFDRLLFATKVLQERLRKLKRPALPEDIARTHNIPVRATYRPHVAVVAEYTKVGMFGGTGFLIDKETTIDFTLPATGDYISDVVFHVEFFNVGSQNPIPGTTPYIALCALPGVRLFQHVTFESEKTLVDDYTAQDYNLWSKFFVDNSTSTGWRRSVGQQVPVLSSVFNPQGFTQYMWYAAGLQTPKYYQGNVEMFVPANFAWCVDPGCALASELVSASSRTISVRLAKLSDIFVAYDSTSGLQVPLPFSRIGMNVTMYVDELRVPPFVYDILQRRQPGQPGTSAQMMRVHRRQVATVTSPSGQVKLDQLKYPGEFLLIGARSPSNDNSPSYWPLMGAPFASTASTDLLMVIGVWNTVTSSIDLIGKVATENSTLVPVVTKLGLTTKAGIRLFPFTADQFYNAYLPLRYVTGVQPSNAATIAPVDRGAYIVPFSVYPGNMQPSGHFPFSATNGEVYLDYEAPAASPANPVEFLIVMSAINFLVRYGDSLQLLYST